MLTSTLFVASEQRRQSIDSQSENSARTATAVHVYRTEGVGTLLETTAFTFDVTFLQEPTLVTGLSVIKAPETGYHYPLVSAGVYRWVRNGDGYYTGAYVYFRVAIDVDEAVTQTPIGDPTCTLAHNLMFEGVAYKPLTSAVASIPTTGGLATKTVPAYGS